MTAAKQSQVCYTVRRTKPHLSRDARKMIYHAFFFHSIMSYGLVFWANGIHGDYIFKLQKRIIAVIMGARITAVENYSKF
jgi:hypothetical protein